jgi:hypothetical protein
MLLSVSAFADSVIVQPGDPVGESLNGVVDDEWSLDINRVYGWGWLGVTPAIADLPGVNSYGGEPNACLEIVTGSDGYWNDHVNPEIEADGLWRAIDSLGNIEWYRDTKSDEARGAVAIVDLNGDGSLEIIGGTTSGHTLEVMDRFGNFVWTFPNPPHNGDFEWPTGVAVADLDPAVSGLEVVAVHRPTCSIVVLDGDISDGVNDGISFTELIYIHYGNNYNYTYTYDFEGNEGIDWDVLWTAQMSNDDDCHGSAAIGDVDNDGVLEVVAGNEGGGVYVYDGATGALEASFETGSIMASPALANLDGDPYLEIVIGESMGVNYDYYYNYTNNPPDEYDIPGSLYSLQWDGISPVTEWSFAMGSAVFSSAAVGDTDQDGEPEVVVATFDGHVYSFSAGGAVEWTYPQAGGKGPFFASPTLADRTKYEPYAIEWQMFRHDNMRTGYYGEAAHRLDVYIGSMDGKFYVINGADGSEIDVFQASGPVHGSALAGDLDGDGRLNIVFQSWGEFGGPDEPYTMYDALWNLEETVQIVGVDIKPGSFPNSINLGNNGVVPVAVLGSDVFDATQIDPSTVVFAGAAPSKGKMSFSDVNGDGYLDAVMHFETQSLALEDGDEDACVSGATTGGVAFQGCDSVRTILQVKRARGKG